MGQTKYYRKQVGDLEPMEEDDLVEIFFKDNKLDQIMMTIKQIDRDHNGYVTRTELEDILKLFYRQELEKKDVVPIIKKFGSIQNRILLDYKAF